jgi:hypothetical protein
MPQRTAKREPSAQTHILSWALIQFVVATVTVMLVANSNEQSWLEGFAIGVVVAATFVVTVGAFWMMWAAFRHANPIPKVLVAAFVPCAFVWYYFRHASQIEIWHLTRIIRISLSGLAAVMLVTFVVQRMLGAQ